jgi:hypothetical protein
METGAGGSRGSSRVPLVLGVVLFTLFGGVLTTQVRRLRAQRT